MEENLLACLTFFCQCDNYLCQGTWPQVQRAHLNTGTLCLLHNPTNITFALRGEWRAGRERWGDFTSGRAEDLKSFLIKQSLGDGRCVRPMCSHHPERWNCHPHLSARHYPRPALILYSLNILTWEAGVASQHAGSAQAQVAKLEDLMPKPDPFVHQIFTESLLCSRRCPGPGNSVNKT